MSILAKDDFHYNILMNGMDGAFAFINNPLYSTRRNSECVALINLPCALHLSHTAGNVFTVLIVILLND